MFPVNFTMSDVKIIQGTVILVSETSFASYTKLLSHYCFKEYCYVYFRKKHRPVFQKETQAGVLIIVLKAAESGLRSYPTATYDLSPVIFENLHCGGRVKVKVREIAFFAFKPMKLEKIP